MTSSSRMWSRWPHLLVADNKRRYACNNKRLTSIQRPVTFHPHSLILLRHPHTHRSFNPREWSALNYRTPPRGETIYPTRNEQSPGKRYITVDSRPADPLKQFINYTMQTAAETCDHIFVSKWPSGMDKQLLLPIGHACRIPMHTSPRVCARVLIAAKGDTGFQKAFGNSIARMG